ncbi:MAG: EAL domain-containing protein [Burkholderiaceae bacterium]
MSTELIPNRRPSAFFALATALAVMVSQFTVPSGSEIGFLWLPTSVVLVGILSRGFSVVLPGVVGLVAAQALVGVSPMMIAGSALAAALGPLACFHAIERLRRFRRAQSHLVQTTHLFLSIGCLQAPIAAACMTAAMPLAGFADIDHLLTFVSIWAIEFTSGVVFVRGLMTWLPNDGSGFCPAAGMRQGMSALSWQALSPYVPLVVFGALAWIACETGHPLIARVLSVPVFAAAAVASLVHPRRVATSALMAAMLIIAGVRVHGIDMSPLNGRMADSAELAMLILTGAALLHLLNSLIEERLTQQRRLRRKAFTNEVSGWPNLRALTARLLNRGEQNKAQRHGQQLAELAIAGLDKWADLAGRQATMAAEREIGKRLQTVFGSYVSMIAHIGSGRFILLFNGRMSDEKLQEIMRIGFDRHRFTIANQAVPMRYSIGVVDAPPGVHEPEELLASLSLAQQHAVTVGGRFYRLTLDNDQVRAYRKELAWVERVRSMLERDRLRLFAQPIAPAVIDPETTGLHFEVLSRMADEDGSLLAPGGFLGAISKAGLQIELDRRVLERTIRYLDDDMELLDATDLCAINVTGPTICDPGFAQYLIGLLENSRVSPSQLAIEITESDTIADLDSALANVSKISEIGIRVAVDDFGTGQATFEYIRRLGPQILKIDGAFVRRYREDALDREIVESIVRLAKAIGASTVAEFVETPEIGDEMRRIGVDLLQGYAIAKPMPISQIKAFCNQRRAELLCQASQVEPIDNIA